MTYQRPAVQVETALRHLGYTKDQARDLAERVAAEAPLGTTLDGAVQLALQIAGREPAKGAEILALPGGVGKFVPPTNSPTPGGGVVPALSVDDLVKLHGAGIIDSAHVQNALGLTLPERRPAPLPPVVAAVTWRERHLIERIGFGAAWRLALLPAVLLVDDSSGLVLAALGACVALALAAATVGRTWRRPDWLGGVPRALAGLTALYVAYRFAPGAAALLAVAGLLVTGLLADAAASVLWEDR